MNLMDIFRERAAGQPDHPAIIGPKESDLLTYRGLLDEIESVATALRTAGLQPGQCVGLLYPSGRDYIIWNYAIWACGGCVVPVAVELVPEERVKIISEINLAAVVCRSRDLASFKTCQKGSAQELMQGAWWVPVAQTAEHPAGFQTINAAFLRFTSGTTGTSKGVVLSHETILDRIHAANQVLAIGPEDRVIWLLSMAHHFAVSIVAYLSFGAAIVLCRNHFAATIIKTTADQQGTLIYGSPMHYEMMAHDQSGVTLPSLRLAISTTTALGAETAQEFASRFGLHLTQAFGIIEIGLPSINMEYQPEKAASVGKLLPAYELRLDEVGLGDDLRAIRLRGKGFFDAYYNPWKTRAEVMEEGWFATGDLGSFDTDGYLWIRGRQKELINVAGMKFFPRELEEVLETHPAVQEACVYPHRHERMGELPHALVVLVPDCPVKPSVEELQQYCGRSVAPYKIPVVIRFVDQLLKTVSDKIIRDEERILQYITPKEEQL
jgi:long-chain acyl-CoA synthetase